jgi:ElaB/YqjD/DUF883 family membrane-anchored ribosome-binding protein
MSTTAYEEFGAALRRLLADAESLLLEGADATGEHLDAARQDARESLHRTCEHLRAAERELGTRARRIDSTVHKHPWETAALAGVAGFVLGMLARRR